MKRWLSIITCFVCLVCILALCSCDCGGKKGNRKTGMNAELQSISDNLSNAGANRATAKVTYTIAGAAEGDADTNESVTNIVVYDDNQEEDDTVQLPYYVPVTISGGQVNLPSATMDEIKTAGNAGSGISETGFDKFSFDMGNYENGEYTYQNYVFEAVVTDPEAFFGTELPMIPDSVNVRIAMRPSGLPKDMTVTYTTASGNRVNIVVTYSFG